MINDREKTHILSFYLILSISYLQVFIFTVPHYTFTYSLLCCVFCFVYVLLLGEFSKDFLSSLQL